MDHLLKSKKKIQKFKEAGDSRYIYQNELDKICFQQGMAYGVFKDLSTKTVSDKICYKAFNITKNLKYERYQKGQISVLYKFFSKNIQAVMLKVNLYQTKN